MKRLLLNHTLASFLTAVVIVLVIIAVVLELIAAPEYICPGWGGWGGLRGWGDWRNEWDGGLTADGQTFESGKYLAVPYIITIVVAGLLVFAFILAWAITKGTWIWLKWLVRIVVPPIVLVVLLITWITMGMAPQSYDKARYAYSDTRGPTSSSCRNSAMGYDRENRWRSVSWSKTDRYPTLERWLQNRPKSIEERR